MNFDQAYALVMELAHGRETSTWIIKQHHDQDGTWWTVHKWSQWRSIGGPR